MNLIKITIILLFVGLSTVAFGATKPNVIIIITDDQGYGEIAAHGNNIIKTPNLDALHQQSVRLTDFHVAPKCAPTRAALMTGTYPRRAGVWHTVAGVSLMRPEMPTMAEVFSDSGYRTAMFGKWHLGESYPLRPHDRGFDEVFWHKGGGVGQTPDYFGNDYGQFNDNTSKDTYFRKDTPELAEGYVTDVWFREAVDFIEKNKEKPFFVWLATNAAHTPYHVDRKYSDPYEGKGVNAKFYGMITNIDDNVGYLMRTADRLSLSENTIVIFMSDNGSSAPTFNAGMRSIKSSVYDGGHRVPFFIRWPAGKLNHGSDVPQLTSHFDVLPTLINLAQLKEPAKAKLDGMDFSSLLMGQSDWPDRKIVVEVQSIQVPKKYNGPSVEKNIGNVVMTSRWRWANYHELYDIKADPGQQHNIAKAHPDIMAELEQAYETWWTDVSSRNHDYVEMILGDDQENPVLLTCHDWHPDDGGEITPWNQRMIKEGQAKTGWWSVNIAHSGKYRISLRRWPKEAPGPLQFGHLAKLKIGEKVYTKAFNARTDTVVNFEVDLEHGSSKLQSWLDEEHGAYFVDVERISQIAIAAN
ncbi:arylsulfatase [Paraglaciecola aquimarina]|uniref:Arylsulfatase n=1 Tax=Paraglaciecola aquimarina TaxID=1235557 RepID=A0ABU3STI2_9ALTE|nr:arylsulfatase [Paraglaciecola aquimarina]MDU0353287.1 arylsulfatase [Paraglaciecola aquimarina]